MAAPEPLTRAERSTCLVLARASLERWLRHGERASEHDLGVPPSGTFREPRGVFVTLHKAGELRGCIGRIEAERPLWEALRDAAISAAVRDPRFDPVTREELGELRISVSVLTPTWAVDGPDGIEIGRHGVILSVRGTRSVFLPQVAEEMGWDAPTTLSALARKAGLPTHAWRDADAQFFVFEAEKAVEPRP